MDGIGTCHGRRKLGFKKQLGFSTRIRGSGYHIRETEIERISESGVLYFINSNAQRVLFRYL